MFLGLAFPQRRFAWAHFRVAQDFSPLELCSKMSPLLDKLPELAATPLSGAAPVRNVALDKYAPALKQAAVLRLLRQLSEVYSVMRITELAALVPFYSFAEVEAVVVDAVKYDYLQVLVGRVRREIIVLRAPVQGKTISGCWLCNSWRPVWFLAR